MESFLWCGLLSMCIHHLILFSISKIFKYLSHNYHLIIIIKINININVHIYFMVLYDKNLKKKHIFIYFICTILLLKCCGALWIDSCLYIKKSTAQIPQRRFLFFSFLIYNQSHIGSWWNVCGIQIPWDNNERLRKFGRGGGSPLPF